MDKISSAKSEHVDEETQKGSCLRSVSDPRCVFIHCANKSSHLFWLLFIKTETKVTVREKKHFLVCVLWLRCDGDVQQPEAVGFLRSSAG